MIARAPTLDDQMAVLDLSPETLRLIAARVEASRSPEHLIYRETELDEVWRLADVALAHATEGRDHADVEQMASVAKLVHVAHDLLGQNEDTRGAAVALREAAVLAATLHIGG